MRGEVSWSGGKGGHARGVTAEMEGGVEVFEDAEGGGVGLEGDGREVEGGCEWRVGSGRGGEGFGAVVDAWSAGRPGGGSSEADSRVGGWDTKLGTCTSDGGGDAA